MIITITFIKIGDSEESVRLNNVFICFIICALYTFLLFIKKPFMNEDLNNFSFRTSVIMLITIFLGLFSSVAKENILILILFVLLVFVNLYFVIIMLKQYILLQLLLPKKFKFNLSKFLNQKFQKIFAYGNICFFNFFVI